MIDVSDDDIVAERRDSAGRFALFTDTDRPPACPLPWWSVMLDHGGDAFAILVRLDENAGPADAWTARDLARVALARQEAELARRPSPVTANTVAHLKAAVAALEGRPDLPRPRPLSCAPGEQASPYSWTTVRIGDAEERLDLCPDPVGAAEGITPELLLIVLHQLLKDGGIAFPQDGALALAHAHTERALAAEVERVTFLRSRAGTPPATPRPSTQHTADR